MDAGCEGPVSRSVHDAKAVHLPHPQVSDAVWQFWKALSDAVSLPTGQLDSQAASSQRSCASYASAHGRLHGSRAAMQPATLICATPLVVKMRGPQDGSDSFDSRQFTQSGFASAKS